jgi:D-beta-D-heptose 7-phosphate kinase / D-beta-D-heptose 1-phosphate adenosyltransferase
MRIAMVSEHASPLAVPGDVDAGGQNVHVAALAERLSGRGHDVTVYTRRDDAVLPEQVETPAGYTVEHVPAGPLAPRDTGGTIVATGGCFDVLHAGHVATLRAARALGDCLVVCPNSDASVRRAKGPQRPVNSAADRAAVLSALECVDAVEIFDEDTPEEVLRRLRPDVWVKGGDYTIDELPEASVVAGWGGRTLVLPYLPGRSTTGILARHA